MNCNINRETRTNYDHLRSLSVDALAEKLVEIGFECHSCSEHERLENEPLLKGKRCDERCVEHCVEWLNKPVEG